MRATVDEEAVAMVGVAAVGDVEVVVVVVAVEAVVINGIATTAVAVTPTGAITSSSQALLDSNNPLTRNKEIRSPNHWLANWETLY